MVLFNLQFLDNTVYIACLFIWGKVDDDYGTQLSSEHVSKFYFILTVGEDAFEKLTSKTPLGRLILKEKEMIR